MSVVDKLLQQSYEDTNLLILNDEKGDNFNIPRDVDFLFYAPDEKKANTVVGFINDNRYGNASCELSEDTWRVSVIINMPTTQNLICSVSALMLCIAELFGVEYDGLGCVLQRNDTQEN